MKGPKKNQDSLAPIRKIKASGIAGAIANGIFQITPWEESGDVKGWITVGVMLAVGYFVKSRVGE